MKRRAYRRWLCIVCGFIYDEAKGDPDGGLPPGTRYEDIPDDWECPDCGVRKADFVLLEDAAPVAAAVAPEPRAAETDRPGQVVIVGGGMAAWHVAEALRRRDPARPITLISHCSADVYAKPALSNALARDKTPEQLVRVRATVEAERLGLSLLPHTRVLTIDTERRRVITARGGVPYGQLVLALGARQRTAELSGDGADQVFQVNDLAGYRAFRRRLQQYSTARVLLLGAGLVGCEFADDLAAAGHAVTLLDLCELPLGRLLPPLLSRQLVAAFAARGITLRLGVSARAVHRAGEALRVELTDGGVLEADLMLSALGLEPETRLARRSGLRVGSGIQVDAQLRTSDPCIFALGDCSEHDGRLLPYVRPLREQAEVVAANLCGENRRYRPRAGVVTVKTPSLPLAVYAPDPAAAGEWIPVLSEPHGTALEYRAGERLLGFALSGRHARAAAAYERRLAQ